MPFELGGWGAALAALGTGFGFGFVLERGGLADARRLAAQFYLSDVRVLKVMFTAIVVAMLGVYGLAGVGAVDLERIFVNPTNLWPGILGGLLLGSGFILGGYCPGTALLASVTLKLDALAFVGGVLIGIFAFGETVGLYEGWYEHSGAYGRLTLPELFGVGAPWIVGAVVVMAIGAFWAGERGEDHFGPAEERGRDRRLGRLAPALLTLAALVFVAGPPAAEKRRAWQRPELTERLRAREAHLDPAELVELMHNRQIAIEILDVRSEADFNLFHLRGARRTTRAELGGDRLALPRGVLRVVVANDEAEAEEAWTLLWAQGYRNAYVLAGGLNFWLDLFQDGAPKDAALPAPSARMRHTFTRALGGRWPASRPPLEAAQGRTFERKAKVVAPAAAGGGGCG